MYKKFENKNKLFKDGMISISIGVIVVILFLIFSLLGAYGYELHLIPYSSSETNIEQSNLPPSNKFINSLLSSGNNNEETESAILNNNHILGTDIEGRDVLVCLLGGAATYLTAGSFTIIISLVLGIFWGSVIGYYRNTIFEKINSFLISTIESFPVLILMILVSFIFNFSLISFTLSLGILYSIKISSVIQNKVEMLKNSSFIEAAKELGVSDLTIILKHIIWYNCRREIIVQIIYCFAGVILVEATLRYLNLGVSGSWITWGQMIYDGIGGKSAYQLNAGVYWQFVPPAVSIIILIVGLNLLADGLMKYYGIQKAGNL